MYFNRRAHNFTRNKKKIRLQKYAALFFVAFIFLFFAFILSVSYISGHERFTVSSVRVLGNEVIDTKDIEKTVWEEIGGSYLWVFKKKSVFLYPKNRLEEKILLKWPRAGGIDIYADTMTSLTVRINERGPSHMWCGQARVEETHDGGNEQCYFIDEDGFIFAEAPYFSGPAFFKAYGPVFETEFYKNTDNGTVGKRFLSEEEFKKMIVLKDAFILIEMKAEEFEVLENDVYQFVMEDGVKIMFNKDQSVERLLDNLDSALEVISSGKQIDYIDLRFGNKVFYRFK